MYGINVVTNVIKTIFDCIKNNDIQEISTKPKSAEIKTYNAKTLTRSI